MSDRTLVMSKNKKIAIDKALLQSCIKPTLLERL